MKRALIQTYETQQMSPITLALTPGTEKIHAPMGDYGVLGLLSRDE